jgi:hypothetical protein
MAESATRQQTDSPRGASALPRLRDIPLLATGVILALQVGPYLGSIAVFDGARPILRPDAPFGMEIEFRMNLVIVLIIVYTIAVGLIEFRTAPAGLGRLRELLDCDDATFRGAVEAYFPTRLQVALALAAGSVFALAMSWLTHQKIPRLERAAGWDLHDYWNVGLLILLFALLALFALWGTRSAGLYSWLSRRYARVSLLDPTPLQLFAVRGLRLALFWFAGSGIALLLLAGAQAPEVVLGVIALTSALGIASLILPSLGVHHRMLEVKHAELARVRDEIENRLGALRAGYSDGAAELPALLAWEARVDDAPEWPLGGGVMFRFGLLILIPLGSWLGGALVERLVDATLG